MIPKSDLKGRYVAYKSSGAQYVGQVMKIKGDFVTVKNSIGERRRVTTDKIRGVVVRGQGFEVDEIEW